MVWRGNGGEGGGSGFFLFFLNLASMLYTWFFIDTFKHTLYPHTSTHTHTHTQNTHTHSHTDPYVKIWLLKKGRRNQKWKSKVIRNTLVPIFNESFQFDLSDVNAKEATLEILIMDYDRFSRNDVVGVVYIGDQVPHDTGRQHWDQMMSQPNASISSWHTILPITAQMERTTRKKKVSKTISSQYTEKDND